VLQEVGNRWVKAPRRSGCLPIGNRNNQHCTNSQSADADAIVRRTIAYLLISKSKTHMLFFLILTQNTINNKITNHLVSTIDTGKLIGFPVIVVKLKN
jgi:hypothetical protein